MTIDVNGDYVFTMEGVHHFDDLTAANNFLQQFATLAEVRFVAKSTTTRVEVEYQITAHFDPKIIMEALQKNAWK